MKLTLSLLAIATLFVSANELNCKDLYKSTFAEASANKENVLSIVTDRITENEDCACEIVKGAIVGAEASKELVGEIVFAAIAASPENSRIVSQCAVAIAPDAIGEVQKVLAKIDPQGGEGYSAKGYSAKGGPADNGDGEVAPSQGEGLQSPLLQPAAFAGPAGQAGAPQLPALETSAGGVGQNIAPDLALAAGDFETNNQGQIIIGGVPFNTNNTNGAGFVPVGQDANGNPINSQTGERLDTAGVLTPGVSN